MYLNKRFIYLPLQVQVQPSGYRSGYRAGLPYGEPFVFRAFMVFFGSTHSHQRRIAANPADLRGFFVPATAGSAASRTR